jgi:hypothetical protein
MKDYTLFILGNGRKGCLERTVASWETNLIDKPKHKIIFDDSGNQLYREYLNKRFGDRFTIVPIGDIPMGQIYGINFIYNYLREIDTDYIFELEEDWLLFRPLKMQDLIEILDSNQNIVQVRVPRTPWTELDLYNGSTISHFLSMKDSKASLIKHNKLSWYEWRGPYWFWSHNPSLYRKSITNLPYPGEGDQHHEMQFGCNILEQNKDAVISFYAENTYDAYIYHLGTRDKRLQNGMSAVDYKDIYVESIIR